MKPTTIFVAACCRWPQNQEAKDRVALAAANITDWNEVKGVAERHRVMPLVHNAIKDLDDVPADFRAWVKRHAQAISIHALGLANECAKIDRALKDAGLAPLHIKGPILAQLAYGSVALKYSRDLDIFIAEEDVEHALRVLMQAGYRFRDSDVPMSARQVAALKRNFKDLAFIGPHGTLIELHWRFTYNKKLLSGLDREVQVQTVAVTSMTRFQTFDDHQMLAYLAVHGAVHHWKRLKWLADFAAFVAQLPDEVRDQVISDVSAGPDGDAVAQALQLCDTFFGSTYAPPMSSKAQALYDHAALRIDQPYVMAKNFWGDLRFADDLIATRHLYPNLWDCLMGLGAHMRGQEDVVALPMPAGLNFIYPIIRLPSLAWRRWRS